MTDAALERVVAEGDEGGCGAGGEEEGEEGAVPALAEQDGEELEYGGGSGMLDGGNVWAG